LKIELTIGVRLFPFYPSPHKQWIAPPRRQIT